MKSSEPPGPTTRSFSSDLHRDQASPGQARPPDGGRATPLDSPPAATGRADSLSYEGGSAFADPITDRLSALDVRPAHREDLPRRATRQEEGAHRRAAPGYAMLCSSHRTGKRCRAIAQHVRSPDRSGPIDDDQRTLDHGPPTATESTAPTGPSAPWGRPVPGASRPRRHRSVAGRCLRGGPGAGDGRRLPGAAGGGRVPGRGDQPRRRLPGRLVSERAGPQPGARRVIGVRPALLDTRQRSGVRAAVARQRDRAGRHRDQLDLRAGPGDRGHPLVPPVGAALPRSRLRRPRAGHRDHLHTHGGPGHGYRLPDE